MTISLRATGALLEGVRTDLTRRHAFAAERVGFIACRAALARSGDLLILAEGYYPVADEDYLDELGAAATMGPAAIRKAMQVALSRGVGMFHVHIHEHRGRPTFSDIDRQSSAEFVPDFFNVAPRVPHGVIVLSRDHAAGLCWMDHVSRPRVIDRISVVDAPMQFLRAGM